MLVAWSTDGARRPRWDQGPPRLQGWDVLGLVSKSHKALRIRVLSDAWYVQAAADQRDCLVPGMAQSRFPRPFGG